MLAYEELKGAGGREVWFRAPRYEARKLFPHLPPRVGVKTSLHKLHDISLGGVRVTNLPSGPKVKIGDQLGMLLLDSEDALSLSGEVVHHSTPETFGVEFRSLSVQDKKAVGDLIGRLHAKI